MINRSGEREIVMDLSVIITLLAIGVALTVILVTELLKSRIEHGLLYTLLDMFGLLAWFGAIMGTATLVTRVIVYALYWMGVSLDLNYSSMIFLIALCLLAGISPWVQKRIVKPTITHLTVGKIPYDNL